MRNVPNVRVQPALLIGRLPLVVVVPVRAVAGWKKPFVAKPAYRRVGQVVERVFDFVVPKVLRLRAAVVAVVPLGKRVRQVRAGLFAVVGKKAAVAVPKPYAKLGRKFGQLLEQLVK